MDKRKPWQINGNTSILFIALLAALTVYSFVQMKRMLYRNNDSY